MMRRGKPGFTIVELLIVVVIIAILAAITIVTYSGVQQRANNTAIIDAASKSLRMIQAYIAANDKYPAVANSCITTTSGCLWGGSSIGASATFDTSITTVGAMPRSVPVILSSEKGIFYIYSAGRTMNGVVQPAALVYYLSGGAQQCVLSGVTNSGGTTMVSSSTGYTSNYSTSTACVITISGPSA